MKVNWNHWKQLMKKSRTNLMKSNSKPDKILKCCRSRTKIWETSLKGFGSSFRMKLYRGRSCIMSLRIWRARSGFTVGSGLWIRRRSEWDSLMPYRLLISLLWEYGSRKISNCINRTRFKAKAKQAWEYQKNTCSMHASTPRQAKKKSLRTPKCSSKVQLMDIMSASLHTVKLVLVKPIQLLVSLTIWVLSQGVSWKCFPFGRNLKKTNILPSSLNVIWLKYISISFMICYLEDKKQINRALLIKISWILGKIHILVWSIFKM